MFSSRLFAAGDRSDAARTFLTPNTERHQNSIAVTFSYGATATIYINGAAIGTMSIAANTCALFPHAPFFRVIAAVFFFTLRNATSRCASPPLPPPFFSMLPASIDSTLWRMYNYIGMSVMTNTPPMLSGTVAEAVRVGGKPS